jgi:hypothetical protein
VKNAVSLFNGVSLLVFLFQGMGAALARHQRPKVGNQTTAFNPMFDYQFDYRTVLAVNAGATVLRLNATMRPPEGGLVTAMFVQQHTAVPLLRRHDGNHRFVGPGTDIVRAIRPCCDSLNIAVEMTLIDLNGSEGSCSVDRMQLHRARECSGWQVGGTVLETQACEGN